MDKMFNMKEKNKVLVADKSIKVICEGAYDVILHKGDKFIVLKEQTSESESLGNKVIDEFNSALEGSLVKVKLISDDSSNVDGVKTTAFTFEAVVVQDESEEMIDTTNVVPEFTEEFDKIINDVLIDKNGFDNVESDGISKFWVNKVEIEGQVENTESEEEIIQPVLSGGTNEIIEPVMESKKQKTAKFVKGIKEESEDDKMAKLRAMRKDDTSDDDEKDDEDKDEKKDDKEEKKEDSKKESKISKPLFVRKIREEDEKTKEEKDKEEDEKKAKEEEDKKKEEEEKEDKKDKQEESFKPAGNRKYKNLL